MCLFLSFEISRILLRLFWNSSVSSLLLCFWWNLFQQIILKLYISVFKYITITFFFIEIRTCLISCLFYDVVYIFWKVWAFLVGSCNLATITICWLNIGMEGLQIVFVFGVFFNFHSRLRSEFIIYSPKNNCNHLDS